MTHRIEDSWVMDEFAVKRFVRLVLFSERQRKILTKEEIVKQLGISSKTFSTLFDETQKVLVETFGMRLKNLPHVVGTKPLDTVASRARKQNETKTQKYVLINDSQVHYRAEGNQDEGVLIFVISCIFLKTSIKEDDLSLILEAFELDTNIISDYLRLKYLVKDIETDGSLSFRLGPRALVEFPEEQLVKIISLSCNDPDIISQFSNTQ